MSASDQSHTVYRRLGEVAGRKDVPTLSLGSSPNAAGTRKKEPDLRNFFGAEDGIRTRDPHLGKKKAMNVVSA